MFTTADRHGSLDVSVPIRGLSPFVSRSRTSASAPGRVLIAYTGFTLVRKLFPVCGLRRFGNCRPVLTHFATWSYHALICQTAEIADRSKKILSGLFWRRCSGGFDFSYSRPTILIGSENSQLPLHSPSCLSLPKVLSPIHMGLILMC